MAALQAMHARIAAHTSPWATQIEVVYIARAALRYPLLHAPDAAQYPRFEHEGGFFVNPLEDGWLAQCWIVREYGIALAGPDPHTLINPIDPNAMRRAVARMWQGDAAHDPTWLAWLRVRENHALMGKFIADLGQSLSYNSLCHPVGVSPLLRKRREMPTA